MSKQGKPYEQVVAAIMRLFDPRASVSQGKWVVGPDGRRELDVLIEGTAGGEPTKGIVECKDFNPKTTGPVGIAYLDALDSKRRDLSATFALLCSNAGFTADAVRKAKRLGIGLVAVLRKGDPRLRFAVVDEIYTRKVRLESISLTLTGAQPIALSDAPLYSVLWEGLPVASWIYHRVTLLVASNPIVAGKFTATHSLLHPLSFSWPGGAAQATTLAFSFTLTGGWYAHSVEIDSTTGFYDWLRQRVRHAPGPGQLEYRGVDVHGGTPIARPPDREFVRERFLQDEVDMRILLIEGIDNLGSVPELDRHIAPADLNTHLETLPTEVTTSSSTEHRVTPNSSLQPTCYGLRPSPAAELKR